MAFERSASSVKFNSKFERGFATDLSARKIRWDYEPATYRIVLPASPGTFCAHCESKAILRNTRYTPDFEIMNRKGERKLIVETKGRFTGKDRKVALAFIAQHPRIPYRLVFQRNNTLSKSSKTRYGDWCDKHGINWAIGKFPPAWEQEVK